MSFIHPVADADAVGLTADLYANARQAHGRVLNLHRAFAHLPSFVLHFEAMTAELKATMDTRRYELVTLAAALALRSSYCALAHASVLLRDGMEADELARIAGDRQQAHLSDVERQLMAYAEDIVWDAAAVDGDRVNDLRQLGLSDKEISEAAAAAALRCYFSKYLDAVGTEADADFAAMSPLLRHLLVRGRAISDT